MPGRLFLETPLRDVSAELGIAEDAIDEDGPRRNIAPGEEVCVIAPPGRLARMRWGLIPVGRKNARGRPVMETIVNARSETVFDKSAYEGVERAIVPADGWYEWTGQKGRKTAWRITRKDARLVFFAAISDTWLGPGGIKVAQVATITCAPNADVRDIHDRMGAILAPQDVALWLSASDEGARELLRPLPDGSLSVEKMSVDPSQLKDG